MTTTTEVVYETRSVKTVRGMEARTRAKLERDGWEFVSQTHGTVRSELTFRRPKPKTPWKAIAIGGGALVVVLASIITINALRTNGVSPSGDAATSPSTAPSQPATSGEPTDPSAPSAAPSSPTVTNITVDELLDKLNSPSTSGINVGDQFRITGELFMSDLWMTGASGEYSVMLKAQGGAQDLPVFVNEADAAEWQDGTKVEMVVEMVEVTIDGETTDGWLRAESAQTVP